MNEIEEPIPVKITVDLFCVCQRVETAPTLNVIGVENQLYSSEYPFNVPSGRYIVFAFAHIDGAHDKIRLDIVMDDGTGALPIHPRPMWIPAQPREDTSYYQPVVADFGPLSIEQAGPVRLSLQLNAQELASYHLYFRNAAP